MYTKKKSFYKQDSSKIPNFHLVTPPPKKEKKKNVFCLACKKQNKAGNCRGFKQPVSFHEQINCKIYCYAQVQNTTCSS